MNNLRIAVATLGFIAAIFLPPWIPVLCIILLSVRFRAWEAILIGAFIDLSWLPSGTLIHSLPLFTIAALLIVWGFEPLRAQFLVSQ
jgi:hypothetical protein